MRGQAKLGIICIIFILLLTLAHKEAIAQQTWSHAYGESDDDYATFIQLTSDGGYIVAGYTYSFDAPGYNDMWILKLDSSGNVTWQKAYGGGSHNEIATSIQQTSDGGYIVAGYTYSFGAGDNDFWVLKLDASGNVTWQKTYGGSYHDEAYSIHQTSDGGYIVAGFTGSFGAGGYDFWVLKLDSSGNITWQKTYGGSSYEYANSIEQTSDGGYIIAGYTSSFGAGSQDMWILKLDSSGNVTWQKTYGGSESDMAYSIQQTSDGGYIVAGRMEPSGAGYYNFWVLKLNASGNVTWQKTYSGSSYDEAKSIKQTSDGGYIVAGYTESFGAGYEDIWVLKLDSSGNVTWQKTYGGSNDDRAKTIKQTSDGGYIVAGSTESYGAGYYNIWVLKLTATGASCGASGNTSITPASTSITPADSAATIAATSVVATNSNATVLSTTASRYDQCCDGIFGDVTSANIFCIYIEKLYNAGIVSGCSTSPLLYCPSSNTQRQAMAKFVCLAMNSLSAGSCITAACAGTFSDVPASNPFCTYIEGLYTAGVIGGCSTSPLNYCPASLVQRQAMAKFICLGMNAANPGSCTTVACAGTFGDVTSSNPFCPYIEGLYTAGVVSGCTSSPLNYCPLSSTNRQTMAKFIVNGFAI